MTLLVVVAFIAVMVGNGSTTGVNGGTTATTSDTIARPSLPGDDSTASTVGGTTARCKDGTYAFLGGNSKDAQDELCKSNGGVDQVLPNK